MTLLEELIEEAAAQERAVHYRKRCLFTAELLRRAVGEIERLRQWQQTPEGPNCSGLEQLNRIVAGLVREYGDNGVLTLSNVFANEIPLGRQIKWGCTGGGDDFIVIREAAEAST